MNKALLVIDVQLGVFMRKDYDGKAVYREREFLENLRSLTGRARKAGVAVIYIQHLYEDFPIMAKGKPMWQVHPDIAPLPGELVIDKRHADAFFDTELQAALESLGVSELILTGMQTEYCVDTTCRRAFSLGYKNTLVSDGHSTLDSDILTAEQIVAHHNKVLGSQFAGLKSATEIVF